MTGYNLPDNVSASDPNAPWNERDADPLWCQCCGAKQSAHAKLTDDCEECGCSGELIEESNAYNEPPEDDER